MLIATVDDDTSMQALLQAVLAHAGHQVQSFLSGPEFLAQGCLPGLDMLVVDWELPGMQGPELVAAARALYGPQLPIVFATQRQQEADLVQGLQAGADDFVSKPLQLPIFMARLDALARRSSPSANASEAPLAAQFGPYRFDPDGRHVHFGAQCCALKGREYALARYFFSHTGQLVTRTQLRQLFWPGASMEDTRSLDTHISRLRAKLQLGQLHDPQDPCHYVLQNVYGSGYRLERL